MNDPVPPHTKGLEDLAEVQNKTRLLLPSVPPQERQPVATILLKYNQYTGPTAHSVITSHEHA